MRPTVYIETTIPSYLAARPSRDIVAVATIHEVDYLLTWNCAHMANGPVRRKLQEVNAALGLRSPTICTPEELLSELAP